MNIKDRIIGEVEENLGPGAVMVIADAMERCSTLKELLDVQNETKQSIQRQKHLNRMNRRRRLR